MDFIVAYLYFFYIGVKDSFDTFFSETCISWEDFYPFAVNDCLYSILVQHILNHSFFQCCTDTIVAFTKNNFLNQVSMVNIAIRAQMCTAQCDRCNTSFSNICQALFIQDSFSWYNKFPCFSIHNIFI